MSRQLHVKLSTGLEEFVIDGVVNNKILMQKLNTKAHARENGVVIVPFKVKQQQKVEDLIVATMQALDIKGIWYDEGRMGEPIWTAEGGSGGAGGGGSGDRNQDNDPHPEIVRPGRYRRPNPFSEANVDDNIQAVIVPKRRRRTIQDDDAGSDENQGDDKDDPEYVDGETKSDQSDDEASGSDYDRDDVPGSPIKKKREAKVEQKEIVTDNKDATPDDRESDSDAEFKAYLKWQLASKKQTKLQITKLKDGAMLELATANLVPKKYYENPTVVRDNAGWRGYHRIVSAWMENLYLMEGSSGQLLLTRTLPFLIIPLYPAAVSLNDPGSRRTTAHAHLTLALKQGCRYIPCYVRVPGHANCVIYDIHDEAVHLFEPHL